ncbi:MAG TPA: hypothetical protein VK929_09800 [Longimicrobiales bacterium]|nr:hypothetical protein [Longimicrobiales bacterium]
MPPGVGPEVVIEEGFPTEFLTCPPGETANPDVRNIGAEGGELATAGHRLTIPPSANAAQRAVVFRELPGERLGVEIEQQRAASNALGRTATLWIDTRRCSSNALGAREWFVWRMNPGNGPSQKLQTRRVGSWFVTQIDSTSGFIIAH